MERSVEPLPNLTSDRGTDIDFRVKVFPSYLREQFPERQLFSLMCVATIFPLETAKFKTVPSLTSASSASGLGILTAKLLPHF
jgi:hypothetical protein